MDATPGPRQPTLGLISDVFSQVTSLFQTELHLLRAEMNEKIALVVRSIVLLMVAAVLMLAALFLLLQALVGWLVMLGLAPPLAALAVGGGILLVGLIAALIAARALSPKSLAPRRSLDQLSREARALKGQTS
jgi:uncharacterized membrane protein YqjE